MHFAVQQKLAQHCKSIILKLKKKKWVGQKCSKNFSTIINVVPQIPVFFLRQIPASYFAKKETVAQRGEGTFPRSHSNIHTY